MQNNPIDEQIKEYMDFCQYTRRFSPRTMDVKKYSYKSFIQSSQVKSLEDVTNDIINKWVADQAKKGLKARSINNSLYQLKVLVKYHIDSGMVIPGLRLGLITRQKEEPPRKLYYTKEQIERVLAVAGQQEWLLVKLCFDCGLRISELRNIRLRDITSRQIHVVGKCQKRRYVIMSEEARKKLDQWIKDRHITDYLWDSPYYPGSPLCGELLRRMMNGAFARAGIDGFYPHALRHSFATDLQHNGASIGQIKIALGHSSEATTERYMHDLDGYDITMIWSQYKYVKTKKTRVMARRHIPRS